jgi:hypothetical protein
MGGAVAEQMALTLANLRLRTALRDQAIRDPPTGLFNRRYLQETLERELQRAARRDRPVSVMMLDLDHFSSAATMNSVTKPAMLSCAPWASFSATAPAPNLPLRQ